jgi:WD40 repeat protein/serine/threonine protein kinase
MSDTDTSGKREPTAVPPEGATGPFTPGVPPQENDRPAPLERLGEYRIVREVGRGGMGVVYEAVQESLGRHVALKVLPSHGFVTPVQLQRFQQEARAAASLHHTNIVPVFGVGEHQGIYYYTMQFIMGRGLDTLLRDLREGPVRQSSPTPEGRTPTGPPPRNPATDNRPSERVTLPDGAASSTSAGMFAAPPAGSAALSPPGANYFHDIARIGVQVADALGYAHKQGILHRDIKPSNLLLDAQGTVWVTDFGLAKSEGSTALTTPGDLVGTPRYLAPERLRGVSEPRCDIYSLGLTLYEMLTFRPAFPEQDRSRLIEQVLFSEPVPPRRLNPRIPRDLETIVLKASAREVNRRYTSADDLADDLRRFLADQPILARPVGSWERLVKWARRRPAVAGLLALVAVLFFTGFALVAWKWREAEDARQRALDLADAQEKAAAEASRERDAAQEARDDKARALAATEVSLYHNRIALAHREWLAGNVARADELLTECPEKFRRWEWDYLRRLCRARLLTIKAEGALRGVAFSADDKGLVAGNSQGNVLGWDATTGAERFVARLFPEDVQHAAISPDGSLLAVAGGARVVKVLDAATGKELFTLAGHTQRINALAFSADGKWLATGGEDKTVRLWDITRREAATGKLLRGHTDIVTGVAVSTDGRRVFSAAWDGTIRVWDAAGGNVLMAIPAPGDRLQCLALSPDGRHVAAAGHGKLIRLWETATGKEIRAFWGHGDSVHGLAFSPDGHRLASGSVDRTVRVWDAQTGQELFTLRGHGSAVVGVAFSHDGQRLASTDTAGVLHVWDAGTPQEARVLIGHGTIVSGVAFSPDGTRVATAGWDRTVRVWDAATGENVLILRDHELPVLSVAFHPDGKQLAAASGDRSIKIWNALTGKVVQTLRDQGEAGAIHYSVAWAPDGKHLAAAGRDSIVRIWDIATGKARSLRGHKGHIFKVTWSPDGRRLASGDHESVRLWDPTAGQLVRTLPGEHGVAFSPDGEILAAAAEGNLVMLFNAETGAAVRILRGHSGHVLGIAFHPDGQRLATAGNDKTVRLWDLVTGREVLNLKGHTDSIFDIAFSPDGRRLASVGQDGTARIWDATPMTR